MTTALARPGGILPGLDTWNVMREQAAILVKSGFLPTTINTPEKAVAVILKGWELAVPAMYALSNIAIINGKPVASAELLLALIYRDQGDDALHILATDASLCRVAYRRRGWAEHRDFEFTINEARTAGLLGKEPWQKYPAAMLRARAISAVARLAFPDSIAGMYTPEELGADVTVDAEGLVTVVEETVDVEAAVVAATEAPAPRPPAGPAAAATTSPSPAGASASSASAEAPPSAQSDDFDQVPPAAIRDSQKRQITALLGPANIGITSLLERLELESLDQLSAIRADKAIEWLQRRVKRQAAPVASGATP